MRFDETHLPRNPANTLYGILWYYIPQHIGYKRYLAEDTDFLIIFNKRCYQRFG